MAKVEGAVERTNRRATERVLKLITDNPGIRLDRDTDYHERGLIVHAVRKLEGQGLVSFVPRIGWVNTEGAARRAVEHAESCRSEAK